MREMTNKLPKFRPCTGPSLSRVHIFACAAPALTLCATTSPSRAVVGKIHHSQLCKTCLNTMAKMRPDILTCDDTSSMKSRILEILNLTDIE